VHIGTGNYHSATARLYTDFGLFTTDEQIGSDVADMFNYLTGYGRPTHYRKVLTAPNQLREGLLAEIARTVEAHSAAQPARILMKMNALVDGRCIRALYEASQAGVQVDLNVRGICCLRPGVPGLSDNIRVVSIVGRLLEHSRVYAFQRGGAQALYIASADLMPRNLDHRVELAVPVEAPELQAELLDTLERAFTDNQNSWELDAEGTWTRRSPHAGEEPRSLQLELAELYTHRSVEERPGEQWSLERDPLAASRQRAAAAGSSSSAVLRSSTV
jgi:polyphosphate kinase